MQDLVIVAKSNQRDLKYNHVNRDFDKLFHSFCYVEFILCCANSEQMVNIYFTVMTVSLSKFDLCIQTCKVMYVKLKYTNLNKWNC